ncbi:RDD family protein [Marinospirillum sp.]|uniref:RDD family protein n=1 Tax=Marinospirillum sp. TaxID=2183934 RepID=UPI00286FE862|nr:RDD family protein [Marinospirillum sp.]MDR9468222.1 RDD family protein [Marinospirillum sp.]
MPRVFSELNAIYPAGLFRRLAAITYDLFLLFALLMLVGFIGVALTGGEANEHLLFKLAVFLVPVVFYGFFWRRAGQTLGMLAWRIRVQTPQGQPLNLKQTLLRLLGGLLSWGCLGLGYLWLFFDREKRTWPDLLSGTQVVVIPKKAKS